MSHPDQHEVQVQSVDGALAEMVTRAEYDVQIATAKRYPRSIKQFINTATELVTLNEEVANDCIYALPRDGKTIEGPSARFAELILHAWGHTRAGARIVNEDSRFITAQGVCHDLQSNTLIAYEVRRRITKSNGNKYSDDMVGVTGNAASSIALRNAITKVIPKALWSPIYEEARRVVVGDATTLANRRAKALEHLQKFGATAEMVLKKLVVKGIEEITLDHLVMLRGIATALKEGDTTVDEVFAEEKSPPASKTDAIKDKLKAKAESQPTQETAPQAAVQSSGPKLEDLLEDIATAPNFEGLRHKSEQALAAFPGAKAQESINKATSDRQAALTAEVEKKAAATEPGSSARKLFEKPKPEGAAA